MNGNVMIDVAFVLITTHISPRRIDDIHSVAHLSALIKNEVPICKRMFDKV